MSESDVIDRRKLFEQVAAHLERQILDGRLQPGDQLPPERDLRERFGVGRPAIREALIALSRAGLVELTNGARARVAMPTASGVLAGVLPAVRQLLSTDQGHRHLQRVRQFFEVGLARQAAQDATPADLARLGEALSRNEAAIGDEPLFIRTDIGFHYVLAEITRNPVFTALHDALSAWLADQRIVTLADPGQDRIACAAHRCIHDAIVAHDADAAEAAMRQHLQQLEATYWSRKSAG
jgi:GntR family transcriptional regulator, sialic acid-inducible nan operon repressor